MMGARGERVWVYTLGQGGTDVRMTKNVPFHGCVCVCMCLFQKTKKYIGRRFKHASQIFQFFRRVKFLFRSKKIR